MSDHLLSAICNLNTNKNSKIWDHRTLNLAPHKPFLMLSILDGIEIGWIDQPKIKLSQDLIETFFRYWKQIMGEGRNTSIALPFYHMQSESFWLLHYKLGAKPYNNSPSLGGLKKRLSYARIEDGLFEMMLHKEKRNAITKTLLETYFDEDLHEEILQIQTVNIGAYSYVKQLELLAAEPFKKYHASEDSSPTYSLQKIQQREYGFALGIRNNYQDKCALCKTSIKTPSGESIIEGAHIIPWSESQNDDPRNGLALCKSHHWMFDSNLLAVKPDYHIKISKWLQSEGEGIDKTIALENTKILLPNNKRYLPSKEALRYHYDQFKNYWKFQ